MKEEINKYININYQSWLKEIKKNLCWGKMEQYADDLLIHCIQDFLERDMESQIQMYNDGKIQNYVFRCCSIQLKSDTSPFYRTWRRFKMSVRENHKSEADSEYNSFSGMGILDQVYEPYEENPCWECLAEAWQELDFYDKALLEKKFLEEMSYDQLREYYGIHKYHLQKDIWAAIKKIREYCNPKLNEL